MFLLKYLNGLFSASLSKCHWHFFIPFFSYNVPTLRLQKGKKSARCSPLRYRNATGISSYNKIHQSNLNSFLGNLKILKKNWQIRKKVYFCHLLNKIHKHEKVLYTIVNHDLGNLLANYESTAVSIVEQWI